MKTENQYAVGAAKRKVRRTTIEETFTGIFLDAYEAAEEELQESSFQCIKYVPPHLVEVGTLDSIQVLNFCKLSRSDTFMDAIAHRTASNLKIS